MSPNFENLNNNHKDKFPKVEYIYPKEVDKIIQGWKDLLLEFERQFEKGTLPQETFEFYSKICNDSLIETQKVASIYGIMVQKANK